MDEDILSVTTEADFLLLIGNSFLSNKDPPNENMWLTGLLATQKTIEWEVLLFPKVLNKGNVGKFVWKGQIFSSPTKSNP